MPPLLIVGSRKAEYVNRKIEAKNIRGVHPPLFCVLNGFLVQIVIICNEWGLERGYAHIFTCPSITKNFQTYPLRERGDKRHNSV